MTVSGEAVPGPEAIGASLAAGASGLVGLAAFYLALSRGTMGIVAPLTALIGAAVPALVGIASGGVLNPLIVAGMLVALAAVALISVPDDARIPVRLGRPNLPRFHGSRLREMGLIVVAGLGFAAFFLGVARAHAAGGEVWWPLLFVRAAGLSLILPTATVLAVAGRLRRRIRRATVLVTAIAGAGDLGGNLFFIMASSSSELAVAVVLSSLYPVQTALLARIVLHERLGRVRLAGVGLAVFGVALLGLGQALA